MARHSGKSRTGCVQCKMRKIKCDESKPSCKNCVRHRGTCSYLRYIPLPSATHHQRQTGLAPLQNHLSQLPSPESSRSPSFSPSHSLNYFGTKFAVQDLHLLHFYTTQTSHSMLGPHLTGSTIWGTSIVTLSFLHPFLLHAIFSLSALHLTSMHSSSTDPHQQELADSYQQAATFHHMKCISIFRHKIQNLTQENAAACAACSSFISLLAWATPGGKGSDLFFPSSSPTSTSNLYKTSTISQSSTMSISASTSANTSSPPPTLASTSSSSSNPKEHKEKRVPWYKILRGGHLIVSLTYASVSTSPHLDIVRPWREINYEQMYLQPLTAPLTISSSHDSIHLDNIASCWTSPPPHPSQTPPLCEQDITALEETLQTLRYTFSLLARAQLPSTSPPLSPASAHNPNQPCGISTSITTLSWTTLLPPHFCTLVEERRPQALVLIAVYCVVLKRAEDLWWIKGKAESLLAATRRELGGCCGGEEHWEEWLHWPRREVEG